MGFRNFRLQVLLRIVILSAFLFALSWSVYFTNWELTPFACLALAALSMLELIHYVEKSNRKLKNFLNFIHHRDFSSRFADQQEGRVFSEISDAYRFITEEFKQLNAEKEANSQYLALMIEHFNIALICLDDEGTVTLMNRQAKRLFHTPYLHNLGALNKIDANLVQLINEMGNGSQRLVNIKVADEYLKLSIHATEFQLLQQEHKLLSFQNIRSELEQHEISSWQKLIRVLTHEIMNSVTPIISLSGVLKEKLEPDEDNHYQLEKLSADEAHDMHKSINSIESRSKGLQSFIQSYRRFSTIPEANISKVTISSILDNVCILLLPEIEKRSIQLKVTGDSDDLLVEVDSQQIEQVLINLLTNAMEAVSESFEPLIRLHIETNENDNVLLKVIDNGHGINHDHIEQIFVPFFTTKQNGTGIGLSLSRQFCLQNKVSLSIVSSSEEETVFLLQFSRSAHSE